MLFTKETAEDKQPTASALKCGEPLPHSLPWSLIKYTQLKFTFVIRRAVKMNCKAKILFCQRLGTAPLSWWMQEPHFGCFCRGWTVPAWAEVGETVGVTAWNTRHSKTGTQWCGQEGLRMAKCKQPARVFARAKGEGPGACFCTRAGKVDGGGRGKLSRCRGWFPAWSLSTVCRQRPFCPSSPSKLSPTGPEEDRDTWEGWEMSPKQSEEGKDPTEKDLQSHHDQEDFGMRRG